MLHARMKVQLANRNLQFAGELQPGEFLYRPRGKVEILKVHAGKALLWIRVNLLGGAEVTVDCEHQFVDTRGNAIEARTLAVGQMLNGRFGPLEVRGLRLINEISPGVLLELEAPQLYYLNNVLCG